MNADGETIPGAAVTKLGRPERVTLWALRAICAGLTHCPRLPLAFADMLGASRATSALTALVTIHIGLVHHSARTLVFGALPDRDVTWDEAALLAAIAGAQGPDPDEISRWMRRLGVANAPKALRAALVDYAAALSSAGAYFYPGIAELTRAKANVKPLDQEQRDARSQS